GLDSSPKSHRRGDRNGIQQALVLHPAKPRSPVRGVQMVRHAVGASSTLVSRIVDAARAMYRWIQAGLSWLSQLVAWASNKPSSFIDQINALDRAVAAAYCRDWARFGHDPLRASGALLLTTLAFVAGV